MDATQALPARTATTNRGNVESPSRSLEFRRRASLRLDSSDRRSSSPAPRPRARALDDLRTSSPAELERRLSASPAENAKPILVIVDDEADVLRSVQNLLRLDYQVATFQHGAEAIKFLEKTPRVHVILSDQRMPGMSGVEVLQHAMAIRPETTRLLFTAYADIRAVVDAINQGNVFRYLAKPCDPELLAIVVRQAVEHHDLIVEKNTLLAELQNSNDRLLEANRVKGAFIEVASHELNTPLTVVLGMIDLWKMSQGQTASQQERQWVDRIAAAAARLCPDRRTHAQAGAESRIHPIARSRAARAAADHRAQWSRNSLPTSSCGTRRSRSISIPKSGSFEADPTKIADVLINLLANAVKFTPDGGTIRVRASAEPRDLRRDSRRSQRPGAGGRAWRPATSLRAVFHRLRHAAAFFRRIPVRQARNRTGPLPRQNLRAASRRPRRSLEHPRRRLNLRLRSAAIAEQPGARVRRSTKRVFAIPGVRGSRRAE